MMLAEGKEQGTIQNEESKLIQNVFEFNDTTGRAGQYTKKGFSLFKPGG